MTNANVIARAFVALLVISLAASLLFSGPAAATAQQATLEQLEAKLEKQYAAIEDIFLHGPAKKIYPPRFRDRLRLWQDDLNQSFAQAGATIDQILKLQPPDEEKWRERRDTMSLYSQPTSPPESRTVFGSGEVQKKARLINAAAASYPDQARAAKAGGEVRLRLVLAGDGTVKYVFPMKPLKHGLTEAAIEAARQIRFEPAIRNGKRVSQFTTLSYEFKKGRGLPPYVPEPEFYF
jgi:TonB family protein